MTIRLAGCVILDSQNQLLLIHRNKSGKEQWEAPGGKVEPGEADETAASREVMEELGVKVLITGKIGEGDFFEADNSYHYVWFRAKLDQQKARITLEPGFVDYGYFSLDDLQNTTKQLSPGTTKLLELHLSGALSIY